MPSADRTSDASNSGGSNLGFEADLQPLAELDGIDAMFDDEDAETDLLYSDGAGGVSKMARVIQRLVGMLMIDQELTNFPEFAVELMDNWGNRRQGRDRVFVAMRDWYEAGRRSRA